MAAVSWILESWQHQTSLVIVYASMEIEYSVRVTWLISEIYATIYLKTVMTNEKKKVEKIESVLWELRLPYALPIIGYI